jgi:hypothetical protein
LRSGEVHVFVYRQLIFFPKKDINFIVKTFKKKFNKLFGVGQILVDQTGNSKPKNMDVPMKEKLSKKSKICIFKVIFFQMMGWIFLIPNMVLNLWISSFFLFQKHSYQNSVHGKLNKLKIIFVQLISTKL